MSTEPTYYASPESTNQYGAVPPMPTKAPKKKHKWVVPVVVAGVFFAGIGIGIGNKPDPVTIEKVVEKEVEVKVPTTPASCNAALDYAGEINDISATSLGIMQDTLRAAVMRDVSAIEAQTAKLKTETDKLDTIGLKYRTNRDACRASK